MKNLETPGKTGRVGRYVRVMICLKVTCPKVHFTLCLTSENDVEVCKGISKVLTHPQ